MADILIDGDVQFMPTSARRSQAWVTKLIGYQFWTENTTLDFYYQKTTDGGSTWSAAIAVTPITVQNNRKFSIYPEWYTPGNVGSKIHIIWIDDIGDDVRHKTLDTDNDILSSENLVFNGATFSTDDWDNSIVDICVAENGDLIAVFAIDNAGENGARRSTTGGSTWAAIANPFEGTIVDGFMLWPSKSDDNDAIALWWDYSTNEISRKIYDGDLDTWTETLIAAGHSEFNNQQAMQNWDSAIRKATGEIYLCALTDGGLNSADLKAYRIDHDSIDTLTNVFTGEVNHTGIHVQYHHKNNVIYVAYGGDPADTWATALNVRYKTSSDFGVTWSAPTQFNQDAAGPLRTVQGDNGVAQQGARFQPTWFHTTGATNQDLYTNFVNALDLDGILQTPIVPDPPIGTPESPAPAPALEGGSISYIGPDGQVYPLVTPHLPVGRFVMNFSGFGMPPFDYVTQRGPFQHGETVRDFFARPRIV
ncbi:MAG: exo-alpha-sialidase, partial [Anaerolineae bacterium]|nr:exo-alpha-sialidase [Anaerolineae bacterium]